MYHIIMSYITSSLSHLIIITLTLYYADIYHNETYSPSGTLLVVDRSIDVASPLMHEITYQSLINDVLRIHGELVYLPDPNTGTYTSRSNTQTQQPDCVLSED